MSRPLFVIHDLISGGVLGKYWSESEARKDMEPDDVLYRYEVKNGKAVNPVRMEANDAG